LMAVEKSPVTVFLAEKIQQHHSLRSAPFGGTKGAENNLEHELT
jgi:hypothetical protein